MKKRTVLTTALSAALLFAGCTSSVETITEENAPTDILKTLAAIDADSTAEDVTNAMAAVIDKTAETYSYRLSMDLTSEATNYAADEDGKLSEEALSGRSIDIAAADGTQMYELLEQDSMGTLMAGLMRAGKDSVTTIYATIDEGDLDAENQKLTISDVASNDSQVDESSDIEQMVKDTVSMPLYSYMGANLIVQPMVSPEYYTFKLQKRGDVYEWTISMKDKASYNEQLDTYVLNNYGYNRTDLNGDGSLVVEQYLTTSVSIVVSMDENGVISSIKNTNRNSVGNKDNLVNVNSIQTVKVAGASESLMNTIKDIFAKADAEELKAGDTIDLSGLLQTEEADGSDEGKEEGKDEDASSKEEGTDEKDASAEENSTEEDAKE